MQKIKELMKNKRNVILALVLVAALVLRFIKFGSFITADEPNWFERVMSFANALSVRDFLRTEQTPHPGVPTMWMATVGYTLFKLLFTGLGDQAMHFLMKLPFGIFSILSVGVFYFLVSKLFDKRVSLLATALYAINPLFLGHTHILHIDLVLSVFTPFSFLLFLIYIKNDNKVYLALSAVVYALALLSKTPAFIIAPVFAVPILIAKRDKIQAIKTLFIFYLMTALAMVIIWPALWSNPTLYLKDLYKAFFESATTTHSSKQVGVYELDLTYYFINLAQYSTFSDVVVFVLSGFGLIPYIMSVFKKRSPKSDPASLIGLFVYMVLFFTAMTLGAKKGERYMMPIYLPLMAATSYLALNFIGVLNKYIKNLVVFAVVGIILFDVFRLVSMAPYYMAYYNPLFTKNPNGVLKRGWGEGLELAADYLNQKKDKKKILVVTWYPVVFGKYYTGRTEGIDNWYGTRDTMKADYAVLYKGMQGRPEEDIPSKVLKLFEGKKPEKVFKANGLDYVWIYKLKN